MPLSLSLNLCKCNLLHLIVVVTMQGRFSRFILFCYGDIFLSKRSTTIGYIVTFSSGLRITEPFIWCLCCQKHIDCWVNLVFFSNVIKSLLSITPEGGGEGSFRPTVVYNSWQTPSTLLLHSYYLI